MSSEIGLDIWLHERTQMQRFSRGCRLALYPSLVYQEVIVIKLGNY